MRNATFLLVFATLLFASAPCVTEAVVYDVRIGLGADADGIPILEKHPDARYIYWNPTHANASDANAGTDPNFPKLTPQSALMALRNGYGDWLLLAEGSTYAEGFGSNDDMFGLSAQYPFVVTTYDPTDPTNVAAMRQGSVTLGTMPTKSLLGTINSGVRNIVFENIVFDNSTAHVAGYGVGILTNSSGVIPVNMLFHNVRFIGAAVSVQSYGAGSADRIANVVFRHCSFAYSWVASSVHSQGIFMGGAGTEAATIEDSVFYHNGWNVSRDEAYGADIFKHNAYFSTSTYDTIFRRNVSGHASSHGLQMRGGGTVSDNVFASNPINVLIGGGDDYNVSRPSGVPYVFDNNVVVGSEDINASLPRGFGLLFENTQDGGSANNNIIANKGPNPTGNEWAIRSTWLSTQYDVPTYFNLMNSVVWNWNPNYLTGNYVVNGTDYALDASLASRAYPNQLHFSYSGNVIHSDTTPDGTNKQNPDTPFPDPTRDVPRYAVEHGHASEDALWVAMTADPKTHWAALIGDYIRAGFDMTPQSDTTPPVLSDPAPSGTLPAGTTQTTLSVSTDENATCKYGTVSGTSYASMPNTFSTTGGVSHSTQATGLSDGTSYASFLRCSDASGNAGTSDTVISFSVASPSVVTAQAVTSSSGGGGGGKKKATKAARTIKTSPAKVDRYAILTQSGTRFAKNRSLALYFSKPGGGYYAPKIIRTDASGKFSLSHRVTKPKGTYSWYAQDLSTGKKSKVKSYTVR